MTIYEARTDQVCWSREYGTRHEAFRSINSAEECVEGRFYTTSEILDATYRGLIRGIEKFSQRFGNKRKVTNDELESMWFQSPIESRFPKEYGFGWHYEYDAVEVFIKTKFEIGDMFRKAFGRNPSADDLNFAFYECRHLPEYTDYLSKNDRMTITTEESWKGNTFREDWLDHFTNAVIIGLCVHCGEPVYGSHNQCLLDAGEIKISFGYGSRRDTDHATGYIHDYCSFVLDQTVLQRRLFWESPLHDDFYPLDLEKSGEKAEEWVFDKGKSDSGDPFRAMRVTGDELEEMFKDDE